MNTINIGDTVRPHHLLAPIGTIAEFNGERWVREVDGWHSASGGYHYSYPVQMSTYSGEVVGYTPFTETLEQYQQRFAVTCLAKALEAGGGGYFEGAILILERLELEDPRFERLRVGSWVSRRVNESLLPAGTVLLSGQPERAEGHTLWHSRLPHRLEHLSGPRSQSGELLLRVVALPEDYATDSWPEPGEAEAEHIREFMIRAWDEGWQEKQDRNWCSDFEASMSVLDLSERNVAVLRAARATASTNTTVTVNLDSTATSSPDYTFDQSAHALPHGSVVNGREQRNCVPGAVFTYGNVNDVTRFVWARTTQEHARNSGNVGLTIGVENVCIGQHHVTVVWDGVSPIHESPVRDHRELEMMPVGTVIGQDFEGGVPGNAWLKTDADGWSTLRANGTTIHGACSSSAFYTGTLRYVHIPVPGVDHEYPNPRG